MKTWKARVATAALAVTLTLVGCSHRDQASEHYTSPIVQGAAQRINLDEVQKAFWSTQGKDLNAWMSNFEKRVNQIYDGKDVVSVDATRHDGRLLVTGFIDRNGKPGYQKDDDKLFTVEQTGSAANNEVPYRVGGYDGRPYYEGHHSLLDNPFLQWFLISHMMGGWGGHYYTPPREVIVLHDYRDRYRQSPGYEAQRTANHDFFSRYKARTLGGVESTRKFGGGNFASSGTKRRSWLGGGNPNAGTLRDESHTMWGARRSSGFGGLGSGGSSWGGRRSGGFGGFGGRRR